MKYIANNENEQEIIDYFLESYKESNFIAKKLYDVFFDNIDSALNQCKDSESFLEVGCGLGESSLRISEMLKDKYFEVSEFNKDYVSILHNSKFPIKVSNESVYELKRNNNSFDVVLFLEVLEHLEDTELALKELFRVSKKYVIISVPYEPLWCILNLLRGKYVSSFGNTPGHINHFNIKKLKKLLSKHGTVRQVYTPIPWIIIVVEKNEI